MISLNDIYLPFTSEFFTLFPAPNSEELISKIEEVCHTKKVDNDGREWGKACKVDTIPLLWQDFLELYQPSIEVFCKINHRVITVVTACPLLKIVSTTASTFLAVEIPTLE